jgi:branched-chain amino acid transport system substrate-binding protein
MCGEENLRRNGISTPVVAALFILGIIIGAGAIYGLGITSATPSTTTITGQGTTSTVSTTVVTTVSGTSAPTCVSCLGGINNTMLLGAAQAAGNLSGTFTIGNMQDLSDGLSGQGLDDVATSGFAISDINAWIQTTPLAGKVTFAVSTQDYKEDTPTSLNILSAFLTDGIQITVGPLNSGTAEAILPTANNDHIVMISPSSTAPLNGRQPDYLFRTPPSDAFQGEADAAELWQAGATHVVILYRNDAYGSGLANSTAANFQALGGTAVQIPYDTTSSNYVNDLGQVNNAFTSAVSSAGAAHVAILVIAYDEFGEIATQASQNYPSLLNSTLPWFGTDGEGDEAPLVNSTYASVDVSSRLSSSFPGFSGSPLSSSVCARQLASRSTLCDGYTLGTYDDVWLAALAILYCAPQTHYTATQDGPCMQQILPAIAAGFFGSTGVTILNSAGDRLFPSYQFFCIVPGSSAGTAQWIVCGTYNGATNVVTWIVKPKGIP